MTTLFFAQLRVEESADKKTKAATKARTSVERLPAAATRGSMSPLSAVNLAILGSFACGVAMTNQHTTVFFTVPTAALLTWTLHAHNRLSGTIISKLVAAIFLGMSPYLYLPISASFKPMDSWGDQRTLSGFLIHFFRREYGTFKLGPQDEPNSPGMLARIVKHFELLTYETLYWVPAAAFVGAFVMISQTRKEMRFCMWVLISDFIVYMIIFQSLANLSFDPLMIAVQARFTMQPNIIAIVFASVGMWRVHCWFEDRFIEKWGGVSVFPAVALLLALAQVYANLAANDFHDFWGFYHTAVAVLNAMPPNAILLVNGDLNNNLPKYVQQCEGFRPDVSILSVQLMSWDWFVPIQRQNYPNVVFPGEVYHPFKPNGFSMAQFLAANSNSPLYYYGSWKDGDSSHVGRYERLTYGMVDMVVKTGAANVKNKFEHFKKGLETFPKLSDLGSYQPELYLPGSWERILFNDVFVRLTHYR